MTPSTIHHDAEAISFDDLRSLAVAKSPCITAAVAIPDPLQLRARIQNALRSVEMQLKETGVSREENTTLVAPVLTLLNAVEEQRDWSIGLLLYRSPYLFRHFLLHENIEDFVTVSERFQIRPLVSLMS